MLSQDSILNQGRYRVVSSHWSGGKFTLYDARDELFGQNVVICEGPDSRGYAATVFDRDADSRRFTARFNRIRSFSHSSLVGMRDHFCEGDRKYLVTEAADGKCISQMVSGNFAPLDAGDVFRSINGIIEAFQKILASDRSIRTLNPTAGNFRLTSGGDIAFLYLDREDQAVTAPAVRSDASTQSLAFLPLECIWEGLDLASQKAISNSYNERSFETLTSPADIRSDIFTLGTICYFLLTGRLPSNALERSIEILDHKQDPLTPPHLLNPLVSVEVSHIVMTAMRLKREDRFQNLETMKQQMAVFITPPARKPAPAIEINDDLDLLEIPLAPTSRPAVVTVSAPAQAAPVAVAAMPPSFVSQAMDADRRRRPQPIVPAENIAIPDKPAEPQTTAPVHEVENSQARPIAAAESTIFTAEETSPRRLPGFIMPLVLTLLLAGGAGAGYWWTTSNRTLAVENTPTETPAAAQTMPTPEMAPQFTTSAQTQTVSQPEPVANPTTPAVETTTVKEPASPSAVATPKTKPQPVAANRPAIADNTPKPKKKVTVDDLINEN